MSIAVLPNTTAKADWARGYTRSRRPVQLVYVEVAASRAEASRREAAIKQLDRARKLAMCIPAA